MLKVAAGGLCRDSLVTVRARSRRVGRPAAGQLQASMSRTKIRGRLAAAGVIRLGRPGINEYTDHGRESRICGEERGQDGGPPVHAVGVRDAL